MGEEGDGMSCETVSEIKTAGGVNAFSLSELLVFNKNCKICPTETPCNGITPMLIAKKIAELEAVESVAELGT